MLQRSTLYDKLWDAHCVSQRPGRPLLLNGTDELQYLLAHRGEIEAYEAKAIR